LLDDGYILWKKTKKENKEIWWPYVKYYLEGRTKRPSPLWNDLEGNKKASRDLRTLFEGKKIFDFPKPLELIKRVITISAETNSILLDFFAGSGTTAHATIQLNSEDGGNRKFICVQLPEPTMPESEAYKEGYKNIAEITKERIRRAGKKVKSEMKEDLFTEAGKSLDVGFRVFKLDSSNINAWDGNLTNFEENLLSAAENIKENRTEEDVLYEILLKSGLDLTQPIEEKTIAGKKVFNIGLGALFICLANDLNTKIAEGIGKWKQELNPATCKVIFKDTGFNDVQKTNSIQILKRYGINEVNTI
jgi:adenine-specific DNA-methyltransferase